jgi:hypothetical protein
MLGRDIAGDADARRLHEDGRGKEGRRCNRDRCRDKGREGGTAADRYGVMNSGLLNSTGD